MSQNAQTYDRDPIEESSMTLMEHLLELRTRLIWTVAAILVGAGIAMAFSTPIVQFITDAYGTELIAIGPTDSIVTFFKVSFTVGAALAMPIIAYHAVAFVAPGLYPHEKRNLILILPGVMLLFVAGAAFAFFVLVPVAVWFLQSFNFGGAVRPEWTIDRYIGFVTRIVFWIGVAFELPIVVAFLARAGLLSGPQMRGFWRQSFVIIAVAAAAITPTVDPLNMAVVMIPLSLLYLASVGLAYLLYRPREPRDFSESFVPDEYRDED